ncbi:Uu.00g016910.m01.CDS01 [Anthostomella pinea]|uniref:Uu.00g016910.m01.CDS01 n=1 Tax=Anthostomella pinea TaxID=933095 RepID=A0AAI8VYU1_9PEZI|nr:Uu.00g016910.m01.CDS01 [Anthostomella pinea]
MSSPIKVGIVGATGNTGKSIVNGLLASDVNFEVTALTRPESVDSDGSKALKDRGVKIVILDLKAPKAELVKALTGLDTVLSCISAYQLELQAGLAQAAKDAGVKRFVPCDWGSPAPRGVMLLRDRKDDALAAVQRLRLAYTVIDVGLWFNLSVAAVPSGRTAHAVRGILNIHAGDGTVPNALTDIRDIGWRVARIIADPRTINKKVFAYTEVLSMNQCADTLDEVSGEKSVWTELSAQMIHDAIAKAKQETSSSALPPGLTINEYYDSCLLRGDNTPESAAYLGYLDFKDLYPEAPSGKLLGEFYKDVLDGQGIGV